MQRKLLGLILIVAAVSGLLSLAPATVHADQTNPGSVVVQTIPGDKLSDRFTTRAKSTWPWYVARASGLIAAASLVILILSGIGQITGQTFKVLDPLTSWASHRALGIAFGLAVLVHIISLLFDHFVQFSIWQVLVPWLSHYRPATWFGVHLGSFYVALGVISFYIIALIIITSLLWVEKKPHTWKIIHLLTYAVILLVFVHGLYIGTDLAHGIFRWLWIVLNITVLLAIFARLWRARTI